MAARPPTTLDLERLLTEDRFVRGLARHLRHDPHGAEDLAQSAYLAALERPPAPGASLRTWFAAVLRRLAGRQSRTDERGTRREQAAARAEPVPSAAEIVARESARAAVVRAVLALDEPYRAVVLLRFFENLPPRAIARRLAIPVETVRTRLKRALERLRGVLDAETAGGRAAWCALLLPFTKAPPGPLASAAAAATAAMQAGFTGVLLMTTKAKLTTLAAALGGLLLAVAWSLLGPGLGSAPLDDPARAVAEAPADSAEAATRATPVAPDSAPARQAVASAASTPTTGSLLVTVVWGDDKTPAPGMLLELCRVGEDWWSVDRPRGLTDEQGTLRFADVAPGRVYAMVLRGSQEFGKMTTIVAGQEATSRIEVKLGMNVTGRVVDRGDKPIAGADVLVTDWGGGEAFALARTGADGTFALRAVATHCHIGARADGWAASGMRQFTAGQGATVELRIVLDKPAAELSGTVVDPSGRPVAGAFVLVGSEDQNMDKLPDGATAMAPRPARARTDAQGRFALGCLPAGTHPLVVRAAALAPHQRSITVEVGRPGSVTIQLEAAVTLAGVVRDGASAAIDKATVEVASPDQRHRRGQSAKDGAFRIDGLAPGELKVSASSEMHGKVSGTLRAAAGETVRWDPVLALGLQCRGRVLDVEGKPVQRAMVEAQPSQLTADTRWFSHENTDADGRFTLKNCLPGTALDISVRRKSTFPEARVTSYVPDAQELVIRLPKEAWVWIQGRVLDPDGKPLPNVHVSPFMTGSSGGSPAESVDPSTGSFRYGPYPPGEYVLGIRADGYPPIRVQPRVLGPDAVWDLGTLRFQRGGTLRVDLALPGAAPPARLNLAIHDEGGHRIDAVDVKDGSGRSGPLAPGSYVLHVAGSEIACEVVPFEVRGGAETRLDVTARRGVAATIEFELPATAERGVIEVVIRDAASATVWRGIAWSRTGPPVTALALLPGDYRVEATQGALRGRATLTATAGGGPVQARVTLAKE